ncbi:MAG: TonB-dependent receptor [Ignavibacteriales bacterium]|nr:TonB-dependent receptor [Ignavibacteriales bacterium]
MRIFFSLFFILFLTNLIFAQPENSKTLSGFIYDANTGETLIGANVFVKELSAGAASNEYGFYSITISNGNYNVEFSFVGYEKKTIPVNLSTSLKLDVHLDPISLNMEEVVVTDKKADENVKSTEMGTSEIVPKEIDNVPVIFGEKDILKTIQLLPGISSAGEGNSGFIVRGGSADQNLIILDEAPVYNASHLLGFFSVFNSDAIKSAKIIKGISEPEYGGRLSSVLDISMKDGSSKNYTAYGGVGLISSRLTVEGPIVENEGSFIFAGRRTYADLFFPLFGEEQIENSTLYFYDFNGKLNYKLGEHDRIFLSGYMGRDVFNFNKEFGFDWGNTTATFRWNHIFSEKLFSNTSLIYSDYNYDIVIEDAEQSTKVSSGIQDFNIEQDFQYYFNSSNTFKFGVNGVHHTFLPGEITVTGNTNFNSKKIDNRYSLEANVYAGHEWKLSELFKINYGLRFSSFNLIGSAEVYTFDEDGIILNTEYFDSGELIKSYNNFEPRFSANYLLDETSSVKFGYARNTQNIHMLSPSSTSTPTDIWQPSTSIVKPEISDLISVGYFKNFSNNEYQTSIELYYKDMKNLIEFKNGADIFLNEYIESQLVFGDGWSYGMELFVEKKLGKFTGWLSYTLSSTQRKFADIDDGRTFPARQDRTHDISLVGIYNLNENWSFSANWVYYTGLAATFPSGKYIIDGQTVNLYTERNGYRMPDYHRLDIGATYYFKRTDESEMSLTFSAYNVYARENAYTINFEEDPDDPQKTQAVKLALFSIVPSITFNFRF